jgi:mannose-6-phosphate isomerase-like protein (cupin superfamily)
MGNMTVTWGPVNLKVLTRTKIQNLKHEILQLPQYEPETEHFFHGGMYCRKVFRHADVLIVGKVHKKEHFYIVLTGRVLVTDGESEPIEYGPGSLILSNPGTQRAVLSLEDTVCITVHRTDSENVEEAEKELVEVDPLSSFDAFNKIKQEVLQ